MIGSVIGGSSLCRSLGGSVGRSGSSIGSSRNKLLVDRSIGHLVRCSFFSLLTLVRFFISM